MSVNDVNDRTTTRVEVIDAVGSVFDEGAISRSDLVAVAETAGVRSGVIGVLRRLPDGVYRRPADMWTALPDVPIEA
ncbi:MAG: DUF2795 domain-containing protein [Ilumatobacteraceae bacterium]